MKAPAGAVVSIYVDLVASIDRGDIIQTTTGRKYLVASVRVQERGKAKGRQHLLAVVLDEEAYRGVAKHMPRVHRIYWYARGKAKR